MSKVKVSLHQAMEFAAQGFEIECYVLPGAAPKAPMKKKAKVFTPKDALIGISISKGTTPSEGTLVGNVWGILHDKLWGKDITSTYIRRYVDDAINEALLDLGETVKGKGWIFSYLLRGGCIRVIGNE